MIKTPQEIEVWYVIPAVRRELAKTMLAAGLKQKKVAELLGVTEAAVSQYLSSKRAKGVIFDRKTMGKIRMAAGAMMKKKKTMLEAVQESCDCAKKQRILCKLHHRQSPIPLKCSICLK